jgi:serine/threonine protein kinase
VSDCLKCHTPLPSDGRYCSHCGTPSGPHVCSPNPTDELRRRLAETLEGRYQILRLLGRGGMAVVFLAQDLVLERQVAIKVLPPDMTHDVQLIARFQQEAKTAAKLDHPNIIPIHRVESEAGLVYFVMKYVSGTSLEDLLEAGPLPIPMARQILRDAALALGHAHTRYVVHRDVKPANIMLEGGSRVVLTDFGISKAAQGSAQLTGTGTIIGTPHYMAPEQARGHAVDGRADQYALGIVGHRILTGKLPFDGEAHSILYQQVFEAPPPVLASRPDTPTDLRAALDRALSKDPNERFATMEEFAAAVMGEHTGAQTVVSVPVKPRRKRGRLALLVLIALTAGAAWFHTYPQQEAQLAATEPEDIAPTFAPIARSRPPARAPLPTRPIRRPVVAPRVPVVEANASSEEPSEHRGPSKLRLARKHDAPLMVDSDPWAVLYVDSVEVGLTPIAGYRVPFGTHQLRLEQDGYRTKTETIEVTNSRRIVLSYKLEPRKRR